MYYWRQWRTAAGSGMYATSPTVSLCAAAAGACVTGASGGLLLAHACTRPLQQCLSVLPLLAHVLLAPVADCCWLRHVHGLSNSVSLCSAPAATSTPAPPACNAPLPDDDTVSRYRSLSAGERDRRLLEAAKEGAAGEVRALLAAGADVAARGDESWYRPTALHWAAEEGHADVASCLLAGGAELNARSVARNTPLHRAAEFGHTAVVRLLAAASADLNARNQWGRTPLHEAAQEGHAEAAAALLEAGADRRLSDNQGRIPLAIAENQQLIQLLAEC